MVSFSPNKGYQIPTVGGDAGPAFANEINATISIIDTNLGGVNNLSVAGNTNVTLNATQAQALVQNFTGALTGNITVYLPAVGGFYCVQNATTGGYTLSVGCVAGANTLPIPQGLSTFIWTDGSATRVSNPPGWTEISTTIASNASSVVLALPAPFRRFRVLFTANTSAQLTTQLSVNSGSSFISAYAINAIEVLNGASFPGTINPTAAPGITPASPVATNPWDGTLEIYPGSASNVAVIRGNSTGVVTATPTNWTLLDFAIAAGTQGLVNAISIAAVNPFGGTFIVEGLP